MRHLERTPLPPHPARATALCIGLVRSLLTVLVVVLAALSLGSAAAGQSYSPAIHAQQENDAPFGYSYLLGGYQAQRYQLGDAELKDQLHLLTGVAFRQDRKPGFTSAGRRWTQVTVSAGETRLAPSLAFADQRPQTPQTVFGNALHWAGSKIDTGAAIWGSHGLAIPFDTPFAYSGVGSLLFEFEFRGGHLDNHQAWPIGTLNSYYLDATTQVEQNRGPRRTHAAATCTDASVFSLSITTSSPNAFRNGNRILHSQATHRLPPHAAIITALGHGSRAGTPLDGTCNRLHVAPVIAHAMRADHNGSATVSFGSIAFDQAFVGLPVFGQTAYADAKTANLRLTSANEVRVAPQPQPSRRATWILASSNEQQPLRTPVASIFGKGNVPVLRYTSR